MNMLTEETQEYGHSQMLPVSPQIGTASASCIYNKRSDSLENEKQHPRIDYQNLKVLSIKDFNREGPSPIGKLEMQKFKRYDSQQRLSALNRDFTSPRTFADQ